MISFSFVMCALGNYTANFNDADITELIKYVADSTGKTIVIDSKVKGNIHVVSSKSMNKDELYELFLSVLHLNGFTAIDAGNITRIIPSRQARTQPLPVSFVKEDSLKKTGAGYRTQVIQVSNVEAKKLIPVLRPLVPPQAHLAAYSDSNVIVITDSAANIKRIRKIVSRLDNVSSEDTEVITLKNASATEAVKALEKLQKQQLGGGGKSSRSSSSSLQNQAQLVADARTNSILVTGPAIARERIRSLAARIDRPVQHLGNARVLSLKHATAKELVAVLEKIAKANNVKDSRKTAIQSDEASNSIIITGSADMLQTLEGVVNKLDVPRPQVLIESIIVEISDNEDKKLGVEWLFADEDSGYASSGSAGIAANLLQSAANTNIVDKFSGLGPLSGLTEAAFGIGKINTDGGLSFAALLKAFQGDSKTNILSTPSIMTLDNKEAFISIGDEVAFQTGSFSSTGEGGSSTPGNPFNTFSRETVGLTLKVTPHINEGGSILLDLDQEVSSLSDGTNTPNSQPVTNERKIKTTVSAKNGEIVVIGGLIREKADQKQGGIPFLSKIPVVGNLFKFRNSGLEKTHLMVFIRPTVLHNGRKMRQVSKSRYDQIRSHQKNEQQDGVELFGKKSNAPVLASWEDQDKKLDPIKRDIRPVKTRNRQQNNTALINEKIELEELIEKTSRAPESYEKFNNYYESQKPTPTLNQPKGYLDIPLDTSHQRGSYTPQSYQVSPQSYQVRPPQSYQSRQPKVNQRNNTAPIKNYTSNDIIETYEERPIQEYESQNSLLDLYREIEN
jgi:general secretion pathway protein D